jgi:hypothetical protein
MKEGKVRLVLEVSVSYNEEEMSLQDSAEGMDIIVNADSAEHNVTGVNCIEAIAIEEA